jgi:hypothetical protein
MPAVVTHMIEIDDLRLIGWFEEIRGTSEDV